MSRLRVHALSVSLDGYAAGPDQTVDAPMGAGGMQLHGWALATSRFGGTGAPEIDEAEMRSGFEGIGATIMGRNMFGPIRGEWPDDEWKGWWGEEPPFHHPVFVLTHHSRQPLEMEGGTTFHFVTGGIHDALEQARQAAGDADIRLGGGTATIRQYLEEGLVDDLHLAIVPVLLGRGERLLGGIERLAADYECGPLTGSGAATHVHIKRRT
jgi:dihydrofolate reductase